MRVQKKKKKKKAKKMLKVIIYLTEERSVCKTKLHPLPSYLSILVYLYLPIYLFLGYSYLSIYLSIQVGLLKFSMKP